MAWCRAAFSPAIEDDLDHATRERRMAQIVAVCDATTWRILRMDCRLSLEETERAVLELLTPLLTEGEEPPRHAVDR